MVKDREKEKLNLTVKVQELENKLKNILGRDIEIDKLNFFELAKLLESLDYESKQESFDSFGEITHIIRQISKLQKENIICLKVNTLFLVADFISLVEQKRKNIAGTENHMPELIVPIKFFEVEDEENTNYSIQLSSDTIMLNILNVFTQFYEFKKNHIIEDSFMKAIDELAQTLYNYVELVNQQEESTILSRLGEKLKKIAMLNRKFAEQKKLEEEGTSLGNKTKKYNN